MTHNSTQSVLVNHPYGCLEITSNNSYIQKITFQKEKRQEKENSELFPVLIQAKRELEEYLRGERDQFTFPFKQEGTDFQKKVWSELGRIPFGETISYGELARRCGDPKAARAVGGANNKNQLPLVIPCHRVINADGKLGGYAGSLPLKQYLLNIEKIS